MTQHWYYGLTAIFVLSASTSAHAITRITKVDFLGKSSPHQIIVSGDGPIDYEVTENAADNQVILEFKNARLANTNAGRKLDTSSFNSKVSLISPYNVDGQDKVRVIVQFREGATTEAIAQGNKLFIGIDGAPDPGLIGASIAGDLPSSKSGSGAKGDSESNSTQENIIELGNTDEKRLEQLNEAVEQKKYVGRKITLQFRDADVADVFKLIGEASGFNIVLSPEVNGKISLTLIDVPWDLALDTVLSTMKLGAERKGNVLRVATITALTQEKQMLQQAKAAADAASPRITRIFPISYATPSSLIPILQRFGAGTAGGSGTTSRDTILVDERTNSLVIQETAENIERMAKIIELLDKPTPQVLIEAKIVEAQEQFSKAITGNLGVGAREGVSGRGTGGGWLGGSFEGGGLSDASADGESLLTGLPAESGTAFGMGFKIGALSNLRLNALLNISEEESRSKTISSPRTVVMHKQNATIVQGTPVLVPTTSIVDNRPVTTPTAQSANLSLNVTPTVTNDGNIIMDLAISSDTPVPLGTDSGIANRNTKTKIVAETGSTIVIGGVYTERDTNGESGIPFLRKIPLIGALFGSESKANTKTELFIFITPRVLNEKESGG